MQNLSLIGANDNKQVLQQLQRWSKKPSLDHELSQTMDNYMTQLDHSQVYLSNGIITTNFVEAGVFVHACTAVYAKKVELLFDNYMYFHANLSKLLSKGRRDETVSKHKLKKQAKHIAEQQIDKEQNIPGTQIVENQIGMKKKKEVADVNKVRRKTKKQILLEFQRDNYRSFVLFSSDSESQARFPVVDIDCRQIPQISQLERDIDEWNDFENYNYIEDSVRVNRLSFPMCDFRDRHLTNTRDLYACHTYSRSGVTWNYLYTREILENQNLLRNAEIRIIIIRDKVCEQLSLKLLARQNKNSEKNNNDEQENNDESTYDTVNTAQKQDVSVEQFGVTETNLNSTEKSTVRSNKKGNLKYNFLQLPSSTLIEQWDFQLPEDFGHLQSLNETDLTVNLFHFSYRILSEHSYFELPNYFPTEDKENRRKKSGAKRSAEGSEDLCAPKKSKSYSLNNFENFCHDHFASEGLLSPRLQEEQDDANNESELDNTDPVIEQSGLNSSENLTSRVPRVSIDICSPDSGRFSEGTCGCNKNNIDNENDHHHDCSFRRNDSGLGMTPRRLSDLGDFTMPGDIQTCFPTIFENPENLALFKKYMSNEIQEELDPKQKQYLEWKKFIEKKTENRPEEEFDIHEYGTNILDSFPQDTPESEKTMSFESLVQGKPAEEVARYFLASLQLANTYNIDISDEHPGEIRPDSLKFKFLSRERYHEELNEFHAPSEETFRERLAAIQTQELMQSTPNTNFKLALPERRPQSMRKSCKKRRITYAY